MTFRQVLLVTLLGLAPLPAVADAEPPTVEPPSGGLLLEEGFEVEDWWSDWIDYRRPIDDDRSDLGPGFRDRGLDVTIPAGGRRGQGTLWALPDGVEEAWFRYHVDLRSWEAVDEGKLPGFADTGRSTARGCLPSTAGDPGWSARVLFEETGSEGAGPGRIRLGYYTYHLDQPGICGEFMAWNDAGIVEQDRWYCLQGHVAMNTPGVNDGVLEAWVDGARTFRRTDLAFRRVGEEAVGVHTFWLDIYFGGSVVLNPDPLRLSIDELAISDQGPVDCLTRFRDDDGNPHEEDIEFLFDRHLVYGCAQNLFCPDRTLTRAELLVMLARHLDPPATTRGFFSDDDGHWAEAILDRMAAAGVISGCAPGKVCPDDPVTRGQVAAFLRRGLHLPPGPDAFGDDDGSTFEADIDALAAAGITRGCGPGRFCPESLSRRDQFATLLARAIRWADGA